MAEANVISGSVREATGKGGARAARRAGLTPGIVYGAGGPSVSIAIDSGVLRQEARKPGFFATLFDLAVDGERVRVLARDLQLDPVKDTPLHVDFLRVSGDTRINVNVRVVFENDEESPGLKRGGVLNIVRHEVELMCRADSIPQSLTVDLTGLDIGDGVHIGMIVLPEGVSPTITDRDFTIATVAAPTVVAEEAAEEAEAELEEAAEAAEGEAAEEEAGAEPTDEEPS